MLETQIQRLSHRFGCQFSPGENALIKQTDQEITEYFEGDLPEIASVADSTR